MVAAGAELARRVRRWRRHSARRFRRRRQRRDRLGLEERPLRRDVLAEQTRVLRPGRGAVPAVEALGGGLLARILDLCRVGACVWRVCVGAVHDYEARSGGGPARLGPGKRSLAATWTAAADCRGQDNVHGDGQRHPRNQIGALGL
jgi:hypothetical protein